MLRKRGELSLLEPESGYERIGVKEIQESVGRNKKMKNHEMRGKNKKKKKKTE